jgi:hypothetical protein
VSRPVHDPVMKVAGRATPQVWRLRAPKPRWLGACLLKPGPWLASQAGQEPRPELGHVIDWEPKAWASPRALCKGCTVPRLGQVSWSDGAHERTQWV